MKPRDIRKRIIGDRRFAIRSLMALSLGGLGFEDEARDFIFNSRLPKEVVIRIARRSRELAKIGFPTRDPARKKTSEIARKRPSDASRQKAMPLVLLPFQKRGVAFLEQKQGNAILADQMGLGKTIQSIGFLSTNHDHLPALIICPACVKYNWRDEIAKWSDLSVGILEGRSQKKIEKTDILIINFDIITYWIPLLKKFGFRQMIIDEFQKIKNRGTDQKPIKRTKAVLELGNHIPKTIGLSGTPIENGPYEFFNIISLVNSNLLPSYWKFLKRYCDLRHNGFGWKYDGAKNIPELKKKLDGIMLRRLKKDVLKQLPPKTKTIIPTRLTNRSEYNKAEREFISWLRMNHPKRVKRVTKSFEITRKVKIEYLKQIAVKGKMKSAFEFIDNCIESDEKLIVFTSHKSSVQKLMKRYKKIALAYTGDTSKKAKEEARKRFQDDPRKKLFICNIKAGGVGINLTAASKCLFLELMWTPSEHEQAEDRIHRIGQDSKVVDIYYMVGINSIEERIMKLLDKKKKIIDSVLGDGLNSGGASLINKLLDTYL